MNLIKFGLIFFAAAFSAGFTMTDFAITKLSSTESGRADKLIDTDLLSLQKLEIQQAETNAPKILSTEQQKTFIANNLNVKNEKLFQELAAARPPAKILNKNLAEAITRAQATEILKIFKTHPVISEEASRKYDTPFRQIGYCFGRAAFAHWELIRRGVDPASIAKLFAIGEVLFDGRAWSFHVATIVRSTEGGWLVIDSLQDQVMNPKEWAKKVAQWAHSDESSPLRFYFTNPNKFRPTPGAYSDENLFNPIYKDYFKDLNQWFKDHPLSPTEKFTRP